VVSARFAKPLDEEKILSLARRTGRLLTLEDGVIHGGFGSAVLERLAEHGQTDVAMRMLGLPDHFVEHGAIPILRGLCGIDVEGVVRAATGLADSTPCPRRLPAAKNGLAAR
jgi:1-deoxy-D-xylulose-5-phosphate synthase